MTFGFGGMSEKELGFLYDVCEDEEVLELGSMVGQSSYMIASVAKHLSCVDVWSDTQEHLIYDTLQADVYRSYTGKLTNMFAAFNQNCDEFIKSGKITPYRGNTHDMASIFPDESFDIIVIDADHTYEGVSKDFELYNTKIKPSGVIIFHDYGDDMWRGIKKFCDEMVWKRKIQLISNVERIAIFKKI